MSTQVVTSQLYHNETIGRMTVIVDIYNPETAWRAASGEGSKVWTLAAVRGTSSVRPIIH
jgi:hypothetical protein